VSATRRIVDPPGDPPVIERVLPGAGTADAAVASDAGRAGSRHVPSVSRLRHAVNIDTSFVRAGRLKMPETKPLSRLAVSSRRASACA